MHWWNLLAICAVVLTIFYVFTVLIPIPEKLTRVMYAVGGLVLFLVILSGLTGWGGFGGVCR